MAHQQRGQLRNATFIGIGPVLSKMLQRKHFWFLFNFEHRCDHVNVMNNESHYIHYITVINVFKEKTSITLQELNAIEKMSFQSTSENRQWRGRSNFSRKLVPDRGNCDMTCTLEFNLTINDQNNCSVSHLKIWISDSHEPEFWGHTTFSFLGSWKPVLNTVMAVTSSLAGTSTLPPQPLCRVHTQTTETNLRLFSVLFSTINPRKSWSIPVSFTVC